MRGHYASQSSALAFQRPSAADIVTAASKCPAVSHMLGMKSTAVNTAAVHLRPIAAFPCFYSRAPTTMQITVPVVRCACVCFRRWAATPTSCFGKDAASIRLRPTIINTAPVFFCSSSPSVNWRHELPAGAPAFLTPELPLPAIRSSNPVEICQTTC